MICSTFIAPQQSYGQFNFSFLDSLRNNFPSDSTYSPNRMIVKFKPTTLDLDQLCFTYSNISENIKETEKTLMSDEDYYDLRTFLGEQRFYVKDLLTDTLLANFLVSIGADTLSRMTFASPCVDTLSITRHGDTIPIDHHLYMNLHFKNDTSIVLATYVLNGLFNSLLYSALPDFKLYLYKTPNDKIYNDPLDGAQKYLWSNYTDVEGAWDFERGNRNTRIAIIDDGIDYGHCEFNQPSISGDKTVVFGWSYKTNNNRIDIESSHGTRIAGIIGSPTNRTSCMSGNFTTAGISGGWGPMNTNPYFDEGLGASLIGYKTNKENNQLFESTAISAIYDAIADVPGNSRYGQAVHVINASWGRGAPQYRSLISDLEGVISSAYEHKVLFVSAKSNQESQAKHFPGDGEPNKVFCVSSSGKINNGFHEKVYRAGYGKNLDLLAPSTSYSTPWNTNIMITPESRFDPYLQTYSPPFTGGTSYAAPQVAGIASLLHSYNIDKPNMGWKLHPEDYEGILKVAAKDINHNGNYNNTNHYDIYSGWGLVNANNIFKKILHEKYTLEHFTTENVIDYGEWSDWFSAAFVNYSNSKYVMTNMYTVRRRKITYSVTHPTTWKDATETDMNGNTINYKIYVWGNGGDDHSLVGKKGLSFTEGEYSTNFQTGYTGVISGYGGNNIEDEWNMIHDNTYPIGNSHSFKFVNYQYELRNARIPIGHPGDTIRVPADNKLAAHYSVFARIKPPTGVADLSKNEKLPTIVNNLFHLQLELDYTNLSSIKIYNTLGFIVLERNINSNSISIDVSTLPVGNYYVIVDNVRSKIHKFIIMR